MVQRCIPPPTEVMSDLLCKNHRQTKPDPTVNMISNCKSCSTTRWSHNIFLSTINVAALHVFRSLSAGVCVSGGPPDQPGSQLRQHRLLQDGRGGSCPRLRSARAAALRLPGGRQQHHQGQPQRYKARSFYSGITADDESRFTFTRKLFVSGEMCDEVFIECVHNLETNLIQQHCIRHYDIDFHSFLLLLPSSP